MNHKEYLELLVEDLNIMFRNEPMGSSATQREKEHYLRIKVLTLHLHIDYLLTNIIKEKFKNEGISKIKEFYKKLEIVYATGDFDGGFSTALKILNKIRNSLSHNLIINLNEEESRIRTLNISIVQTLKMSNLSNSEHLFYSIIRYINVLADYLYKNIRGEISNWVLSIRAPQFGMTTELYPLISMIERPV